MLNCRWFRNKNKKQKPKSSIKLFESVHTKNQRRMWMSIENCMQLCGNLLLCQLVRNRIIVNVVCQVKIPTENTIHLKWVQRNYFFFRHFFDTQNYSTGKNNGKIAQPHKRCVEWFVNNRKTMSIVGICDRF